MKKIIHWFKKLIRFVVSIFASREFAFIYCLIGSVAQVSHTYFLTENISSFSGNFRQIQAILIAAFISTSLLYFVAIFEDTATKEAKRIKLSINIFMFIEILINIYYYTRHLIIDSPEMQIFDFMFAVVISSLLPVTIKLYANSIRAKEWIESMEISESNNKEQKQFDIDKLSESLTSNILDKVIVESDKKADEIKKLVNLTLNEKVKLIDEKLKILDNADERISEIFKKNQDLFVKQFNNKLKLISKQNSGQ